MTNSELLKKIIDESGLKVGFIADYVGIPYLMGWEEELENNPAGMAERHIEMIMDEDLSDLFEDFKTLDAAKRKIVKDLVKSLAET